MSEFNYLVYNYIECSHRRIQIKIRNQFFKRRFYSFTNWNQLIQARDLCEYNWQLKCNIIYILHYGYT